MPRSVVSTLGFPCAHIASDADGSIFNHWLAHASDLARHAGLEKLPVRVMVNRTTPEPASASKMRRVCGSAYSR